MPHGTSRWSGKMETSGTTLSVPTRRVSLERRWARDNSEDRDTVHRPNASMMRAAVSVPLKFC